MIKDNIIYFGYGDIVVGSSEGFVQFETIKPIIAPGGTIDAQMYKNLEIGTTIRIYEDNPWDIYHLIKTVNSDNRVVEYKKYVLDFSNYNEESIRAVKETARNTINFLGLGC